MKTKLMETVEQKSIRPQLPYFEVGDSVDVHCKIKEGDKVFAPVSFSKLDPFTVVKVDAKIGRVFVKAISFGKEKEVGVAFGDVGDGDRRGVAREPAPPAGAAEALDEPRLRQRSELLFEEPHRDLLALGDLPRRREGRPVPAFGELDHRAHRVLEPLRDLQHPRPPSASVGGGPSPVNGPAGVDVPGSRYHVTVRVADT